MGRGGNTSEWALIRGMAMGCLLVGLAAADEFRCYDCASLLSPESSCETGPEFNSSTKCETYCYTDATTHAGVRSYMKRGCTTELECTVESTCRELSRTGPCRSCCQSHLCNDDSPDINGAGQVAGVWINKGRGLGVVLTATVAVILSEKLC